MVGTSLNVSLSKCATIIGIIAKPTTSHNAQANSSIEQIHKVVNGMLISFDLEKTSSRRIIH
jgi:hypothetical protein